jgi:L-threonylcarbamoyladenylate synthase
MAQILKPTKSNIKQAADALLDGSLIGMPTETVYGLAADAENHSAIRRLYEVKARPLDHPIIVHIGTALQLEKWAIEIPYYALKLANKFWPGPMTLVLKRSKIVGDHLTGAQDSIAVRIPNHPVAISLLKEFHNLGGNGVAAPSANKFGEVSPTDAHAVVEAFGANLEIKMIIDGGMSSIGIESTIINCLSKEPEILRHGAVTSTQILNESGIKVNPHTKITKLRFSGNLKNHYAPNAKIIIDGNPQSGDGYLALSSFSTPEGCIRLASPLDSFEFAKFLYFSFRKADQLGLDRLFVNLPQGEGIELAIRDRVTKASIK